MNVKMKIVHLLGITLVAHCNKITNCKNYQCNNDQVCSNKYFLQAACYDGKRCCERPSLACTPNSLECQRPGVSTSATYCHKDGKYCVKPIRGERKILYCFDGVTPWENEQKCKKIDQIRYVCETDDKRSRGTCRFGHCCPHRRMHKKKPVLSTYDYLTSINCDPNVALLPIYQYAFCGKEKRVWLLGNSSLGSGQLPEKKKVCRTHADCEVKRVCVNLMHGVRICMFNTDHEMNPVNPKIPWYDFSQIED